MVFGRDICLSINSLVNIIFLFQPVKQTSNKKKSLNSKPPVLMPYGMSRSKLARANVKGYVDKSLNNSFNSHDISSQNNNERYELLCKKNF